MVVVDASWWGLWWSWMLVWIGTMVSMVVAVTIIVTHRRQSADTVTRPRLGNPIYLDHDSAMGLYRMHGGKYKAALSRKVTETISKDRKAQMSSNLGPVELSGGRTVNEEVVCEFSEKATPITVIDVVIDVLHQADDIIDVDLRNCEVIMSKAQARGLGIRGVKPSKTIRLQDLDSFFISVHGLFRWTPETNSMITLQAPYGRQGDQSERPQVRLACAANRLALPAVSPTSPFLARCIGRITPWEA